MTRIAPLLVALVLAASPCLAHFEVPGIDPNGQCVGDANSDQQIQINELIIAVNNALGTCARLPITLKFSGVVGHEPFACGTEYHGIGTGDSQFIPSDFRFYISNIRLKPLGGDPVPLELEQDGTWQYQDVALIDFESGPDNGCNSGDSTTNTEVHGTVPAGVYTSISFDLGLPFELNHGNASTAPPPLNRTALFWTWNSGYRFFRVDTADAKFNIHLGSTGCNGESPSRPPESCSNPNIATVTLTNFNPTHSVIEADLAALMADNNIDSNEPGTSPGCESAPTDPDCEPLFANFGLNFADGTSNPATQRFFRLAAGHGPENPHVELEVGSNQEGAGALVAHPEFDVDDPIPLPFSECFGGTGDDCAGGTRLFSAVNPGVNSLDESEPGESLFALPDGTEVTLELTAIDEGLVMRLGDTVLDGAGDSVVVGTTPDFHADFETQLSQPGGGEPSGTFSASFVLRATGYDNSAVTTVQFTPTAD